MIGSTKSGPERVQVRRFRLDAPARTARTLLATGDLEDTSQDFERKLRTALAGAQLDLEVGAQDTGGEGET